MTTNPKDHLYSTKTGLGLAQIPAALLRLLGTFESLPLYPVKKVFIYTRYLLPFLEQHKVRYLVKNLFEIHNYFMGSMSFIGCFY